jgi:hypothetical protein
MDNTMFNWEALIPVGTLILGIFLNTIMTAITKKNKVKHNVKSEAFYKLYAPLYSILRSSETIGLNQDQCILPISEKDLAKLTALVEAHIFHLSLQSFDLYNDFLSSNNTEQYMYEKHDGDYSKWSPTYHVARFELFKQSIENEYKALRDSLKIKFIVDVPKIDLFRYPED